MNLSVTFTIMSLSLKLQDYENIKSKCFGMQRMNLILNKKKCSAVEKPTCCCCSVGGGGERGGLQRPDAPDDGLHVRQVRDGGVPAGLGGPLPPDRHKRRHGPPLGRVQGPRRADPAADVQRRRPAAARLLRLDAPAPGLPLGPPQLRAHTLREEQDRARAQGQERQDAAAAGQEPQARRDRQDTAERDEAQGPLDTAAQRALVRRAFRMPNLR